MVPETDVRARLGKLALNSESMHDTSLPIRKKKKHRKLRTGCITCKKRRVKCDEAKPYCVRCTNTGRKCDGYEEITPRATTSNGSRTLLSKGFIASDKVDASLQRSLSTMSSSSDELDSFQYFCEKTAPLLDSISLQQFWHRACIPLYHTNDMIKNLVLSISSVHQSFSRPNNSIRAQRLFFYTHLDKAFRYTRQNIDKICQYTEDSVGNDMGGAVVMASLMFTACEDLAGRSQTALRHAAAGFKFLHRYEALKKSSGGRLHDEIIEKFVYPTLNIVRERTAQFDMGDIAVASAHDIASPSSSESETDVIQLPVKWVRIEDARRSIYTIVGKHLDRVATLVVTPGQGPNKTRLRLIHQASAQMGFMNDDFMHANMDNFDPTFKAACGMLRNHHLTHAMMCRTLHYPDETIFDTYGPFSAVVYKVQPIIEGYFELVRTKTNDRIDADPDFGFIPPLYMTASRCRDPRLRREALFWLYKLRRTEGSWNSFVAARVAQTIMDIEERNCGLVKKKTDIPVEHRIRARHVRLDKKTGRLMLSYLRWPYAADSDVCEECVNGFDQRDDNYRSIIDQVVFPLTDIIRLCGYQGLVKGRPLMMPNT